MANPQLEDGYTKIANELLEALGRIRIPGEAMQVLLFIIRKLYGFHKKEDIIPLSQFCLATGLSKSSTVRAINKLISMNVIYKKVKGKVVKYRINKDFDTWKPLSKRISVYKKVNLRLQKSNTQNIYVSKENIHDSDESSLLPSKEKTDSRVKSIISYYHDLVLNERNFKPIIDSADAKAVKRALRIMSEDEVKDAIRFYIGSAKAKEHGLTLSVALSKHSLNLYRENWERVKWQYEA
ncbi:MAG: replication protein [Nitrospirota bacterium]